MHFWLEITVFWLPNSMDLSLGSGVVFSVLTYVGESLY